VAWVCKRTIQTELTCPVEKWIHEYNVTSDSIDTQSKQVTFPERTGQWINQNTLISKWPAMGWKIGVWFLAQTEICSFSSSFRYAPVLSQPPTSWVLESFFLRVKLPQDYADHSPLPNGKVKNMYCFTRKHHWFSCLMHNTSFYKLKVIHFKKFPHITSHYMFQLIWSSTGVENCCWW
jgi:hypothetical protein